MFRSHRFTRLLLAAVLLFSFAALQAQTSAKPNGGYLGIILDYPPLAPLAQAGVDLQFGANEVYSNGQFIFNVSGGLLDLKTGAGELGTEGGFVFGNEKHHFAFRRLTLDTNHGIHFVSGILYDQGVNVGRWPLFKLASNPNGKDIQLGQHVASRTDMTLSPEAAFLLNHAFNTHYTPRTIVGGVTLNLLLNADNGPQ